MSSAFERLQKLAEEKRLKEKSEKPRFEIVPVNIDSQPSAVSAGSSPSAVSAGSQQLPVAPEKDFAKVANSIVRQIPNGAFVGKSKQMYDYLYSLTRGAVKPTRSVRVSKSSLMRGSGIKSTHTFYNNVRHLEASNLIIITRIDGEKDGNSYEVFLPEEIENDLEQLGQLGQLRQSWQKLPLAVSAVSALTALGSNPITTGVSSTPKTSFKDIKTNDDEAFAGFIEKFQSAAAEMTGKKLVKRDGENLEKIADLLILELKIAARRTGEISSVPAFLTEVLRRKLLQRNNSASAGSPKEKAETVGEPSAAGEYEKKPLDKQGREAALLELRDFAGEDFLEDFKKWYTAADWKWLTAELDKTKQSSE